jgi:hypothetical protein
MRLLIFCTVPNLGVAGVLHPRVASYELDRFTDEELAQIARDPHIEMAIGEPIFTEAHTPAERRLDTISLRARAGDMRAAMTMAATVGTPPILDQGLHAPLDGLSVAARYGAAIDRAIVGDAPAAALVPGMPFAGDAVSVVGPDTVSSEIVDFGDPVTGPAMSIDEATLPADVEMSDAPAGRSRGGRAR